MTDRMRTLTTREMRSKPLKACSFRFLSHSSPHFVASRLASPPHFARLFAKHRQHRSLKFSRFSISCLNQFSELRDDFQLFAIRSFAFPSEWLKSPSPEIRRLKSSLPAPQSVSASKVSLISTAIDSASVSPYSGDTPSALLDTLTRGFKGPKRQRRSNLQAVT